MAGRTNKEIISNLINSKTILVILGQTASGKTGVSLELAKSLDIEIISADSRQLFKYMNIGTAKPTIDELNSVQHHFIDIILPDEYFSAGVFGNEATIVANNIFKNSKLPVVVGGSGLYIKALCEGLFSENDAKNENSIRQELLNKLNTNGIDALYKELQNIDLDSANLYTDKNPRRVIRALEFYYKYGKPISLAKNNSPEERDLNVIYFGIKCDRNILYDKINLRSEKMWNDGLVDEVKYILNLGYSKDLNSLNTVGYKEVIEYLDGRYSEQEALNYIKQNTRHYAKRQMTWFRKMSNIIWLEGNSNSIAENILAYLTQIMQ